jgi:hypothetical protein
MSRQCNREGCPAPATHTVHLRFWAKGHPRDSHAPCVSEPVVAVCDAHLDFARESEWYGPEQREQIRRGMVAAGFAEPDLDTADILLRPIVSA